MFSTPVCLSIDLVTVVELQHIGNMVKSSSLKIPFRDWISTGKGPLNSAVDQGCCV